MPTNFTTNQTCTFSDLETAVRTIKKRDTILVGIEEKGKGWHLAPLEKDGSIAIGTYGFRVPSGGSRHESKEYKAIVEKIQEEERKPKLA